MRRRDRKRCPHSNLRGIYGDEVIFATPRFSRLQCNDCGRFLDGPVMLAVLRAGESELRAADVENTKEGRVERNE